MKKEEKPKLTKEERIAAYLAATPGAIAGQGGHAQTYKTACALCNGWSLTESETLAWLKRYNAKCQPPWSDKELEHKAKEATKAKHEKPRGHLLNRPAEEQRAEPDWSLPSVPLASGEIPATLATLNSDLHARAYNASHIANNANHVIDSVIPRARNSENNVANVAKKEETRLVSPAPEQLTPGQLAEAQRIAGELIKLHRDGAISGADDPEARFWAKLIHNFGATYTGRIAE